MSDESRGPERRLYRLGHGRPDPSQLVEWEIEHYLAERTEQLVREGWDRNEARMEAERRFGALDRYGSRLTRLDRRKRMKRRMAGVLAVVVDGLGDVVRTMRSSPGFALGVILTLGLGIGANAAMFGIVDRLLLRPPDHVVEADRVRRVAVTRTVGSFGRMTQEGLTYPDVLDLVEADGFRVAKYEYPHQLTLGSGSEAVSVQGRPVSHDFFSLLGATPVLGRVFSEEDDRIGAPPTVVLSHEFWMRRFGGDRGVLGRSLEISGLSHTVIGIAPPGFTGVDLSPVDLWLPVEMTRGQGAGGSGQGWRDNRSNWWVRAVARLGDGVSLEVAKEEATALHRAGRREFIEQGRYDPEARMDLMPLMSAAETPEGRVARWLLGVSLVVLLIACANVANLLLARGARRRKESAVRLALGVSRRRLVGQRVVEAVGLAAVGGLVALVLAHWGGAAVAAVLLPDVLFTSSVTARTVAFTGLACLLAGVLAGLAPALQGARIELAGVLSNEARGFSSRGSRGRSLLAVAQAGLSVVLLVGAGLFVQSVQEVRSLDLGLEVDELLLARLELATELSPEEQTELYARAAERARGLPWVTAAAVTHSPFQWAYGAAIRVPGLDSIPRMPGGGPYYHGVDAGYFATLGLRLLQGRGFQAGDGAGGQRVAVVSQSMADSLWEGAALGQCLLVGRDSEDCTTVVGVAEDASRGSIETDPYFAFYLPMAQTSRPAQGLYVRTPDRDPVEVAGELALALRSFSPQVRFARVQGLREILDPQTRSWTMGATMFTIFGVLALVVAMVGLYSLLAFNVAQRTRELGIRTALGAGRIDLVGRVVLQGVRLVAAGLVLGLGAAWFIGPRVQDLLFQVSPRSPGVLGGVAATLLAVALLASLLPALRATRIDPMEALRTE